MPQAPAAAPSRRAVLAGLTGTVALLVAGCTVEQETPGPTATGGSKRVLRLQTPAPSGSWDPVEASDLEAQRIVQQVYDTLLTLDPQTGAPAPGLASSWTVSDDGLVYEWVIRDAVTFHDGNELTAEAVATNLRRWVALGSSTDPAVAHVSTLFDTVPDAKQLTPTPAKNTDRDEAKATEPSTTPSASASPSNSAEAQATSPDPAPMPQTTTQDPLENEAARVSSPVISISVSAGSTVRLVLSRRITPLIRALTHPCFGVVSPAALTSAGALKGRSPEDSLRRANAGSGPYSASEKDDVVTLTARPQHWLGTPGVDTAVLTPQLSATRRTWDLINESSDGFDLVTVDSLKALYQDTQQVLQRDPFSVAYLGFNQANRWLSDERVRRAVAHAIDKAALLEGLFITGTKQASMPVPPALGLADPSASYGHDVDKAKRLLAEAGYDGEAIPFVYPTAVARPYLPLPERIFSTLSGQLALAGLNIRPVGIKWDSGYFATVQAGTHAGLHLLGTQGTYRDPENFLGRLFSRKNAQLGFDSPEVRRRIRVARAMPDGTERTQAYSDIVELISAEAALLPLVFPISALAMSSKVTSYPVSPVLDEPLRSVTLASS